MLRFVLVAMCMISVHALAEHSPYKFEGILGAPVSVIANMNSHAKSFIPYNPTIVEIGAFEGTGTLDLARSYPYGKIYAFEPNPRAYSVLEQKLRSAKNVQLVNCAVADSNGTAILHVSSRNNDAQASLLPLKNSFRKGRVTVQCVQLDDWCKQNGVDHIDFLRLDAGGFEYQILKSSPKILKKVSTIVTRTHFHKLRTINVPYFMLKYFLEMNGFELLSHWYEEGETGEATFVRKCMYDSIFR